MKIIIHRGTQNIGGNCVEIVNSKNKSILLDMGIPLDIADIEEENIKLADICPESLKLDNRKHVGILISHAHQDHFGLVELGQEANIDIYANDISERIINTSAFWIKNRKEIKNIKTFEIASTFFIEDFKITSYNVDHTYDAVAFLIEVDNKKIFYTGDFRGHGNVDFFKFLLAKKEIKNIDALLIEGTTVGNEESHKDISEKDLIPKIEDYFREHAGLCLISCSSQNFDRIVNIVHAKNTLKKELVIDGYTYDILHAYGNKALNGALTKAKVFMPQWQRVKIKEEKRFDKLCPKHQRIYKEDFIKNYKNYIVLYKASYNKLFTEIPECLVNSKLIFSMWEGYFKKDLEFQAKLKAWQTEYIHIHTSGHAGFKTIKKLIETMKPKQIIPIHTQNREVFKDNFENVLMPEDGEEFII